MKRGVKVLQTGSADRIVEWAWIEVQASADCVESLRKKLNPLLESEVRRVLIVGPGTSPLTLARQVEMFE